MKSISPEYARKFQSAQLKSIFKKTAYEVFAFHSKRGCPDIITAKSITLYDLFEQKKEKNEVFEHNI